MGQGFARAGRHGKDVAEVDQHLDLAGVVADVVGDRQRPAQVPERFGVVPPQVADAAEVADGTRLGCPVATGPAAKQTPVQARLLLSADAAGSAPYLSIDRKRELASWAGLPAGPQRLAGCFAALRPSTRPHEKAVAGPSAHDTPPDPKAPAPAE